MDSLRLPPLRFSQPDNTHSLKCVLPPITSPPRPTSISSPWQTSRPLPSPPPPTPYHSSDISNLTHAITHIKPPFPFTSSPSPNRPLPSSAMLPSAHPQPHIDPANPPPSPSTLPSYLHIYPHDASSVYHAPNASSPSQTLQPPSSWHHRNAQSRAVSQLSSLAYLGKPSAAATATATAYNRLSTAAEQPHLAERFRPIGAPNTDYFLTPNVSHASTANAKKYTLQTVVDMRSPLKRTMSTARGMRDMYVCPYPNCSRVSTEQSNMKAHMRMHTGEKPYICRHADCLKAFRWKSSLTYHEKALHARAKPFKCTPCRRSFVEKRKLKMHYDLCPMVKRNEGEVGEGVDEQEG